jgi:uncharacterized protein
VIRHSHEDNTLNDAFRFVVRAVLALCALLLAHTFAHAQGVQPVPALTARVMDATATLSDTDRQAMEARLAAFEAQHGTQIVVLIVASTAPEDAFSYTQRVAETWKIGRRGVGDGLVIMVAKNDRKIWISPAKALEGALPDVLVKRIITERISPRFKSGDFAGGLNSALDAITALIEKEKLPGPAAGGGLPQMVDDTFDALVPAVIAGVIASLVVGAILGRFLGTLASAGVAGYVGLQTSGSIGMAVAAGFIGLLAGVVILAVSAVNSLGRAVRRGRRGGVVVLPGGLGGYGGYGSNGGWGGGGGGDFGGFSSGGGGDFGGGGAGGDW